MLHILESQMRCEVHHRMRQLQLLLNKRSCGKQKLRIHLPDLSNSRNFHDFPGQWEPCTSISVLHESRYVVTHSVWCKCWLGQGKHNVICLTLQCHTWHWCWSGLLWDDQLRWIDAASYSVVGHTTRNEMKHYLQRRINAEVHRITLQSWWQHQCKITISNYCRINAPNNYQQKMIFVNRTIDVWTFGWQTIGAKDIWATVGLGLGLVGLRLVLGIVWSGLVSVTQMSVALIVCRPNVWWLNKHQIHAAHKMCTTQVACNHK